MKLRLYTYGMNKSNYYALEPNAEVQTLWASVHMYLHTVKNGNDNAATTVP